MGTGKWHVQVLKVEEPGFSGVRRQRGAGIGGRDEAGDGTCRASVRGIWVRFVLEGSVWPKRRGLGPRWGLWRG